MKVGNENVEVRSKIQNSEFGIQNEGFAMSRRDLILAKNKNE